MRMFSILLMLFCWVAVIVGSCAPVVDAGQDAATAGSNSLFCDAGFIQTADGLRFSSRGAVTGVYFTLQQTGDIPIVTPNMSPVPDREGLYDLSYDGVVDGVINILVSQGQGVALVSYIRDSEPKVCIATN